MSNLETYIPIRSHVAGSDNPVSSGFSRWEGPSLAAKIQVLLDQIRAPDRRMDAVRVERIANIKKALAAGTYHPSAAEVAAKVLDHMKVGLK